MAPAYERQYPTRRCRSFARRPADWDKRYSSDRVYWRPPRRRMSHLISGSSIFVPCRSGKRVRSRCSCRQPRRVGSIQNSPSDRFLTRTLKSAELVRLPLGPNFPGDAIELLWSGKEDVFGADSGLIDSIACHALFAQQSLPRRRCGRFGQFEDDATWQLRQPRPCWHGAGSREPQMRRSPGNMQPTNGPHYEALSWRPLGLSTAARVAAGDPSDA
jgi:hypothetical protein